MNHMSDIWTTFELDRGQIVTRSYRYLEAHDMIIMRLYDSSDRKTTYFEAHCQDGIFWTGGEGVAPWEFQGIGISWSSCGNPFYE